MCTRTQPQQNTLIVLLSGGEPPQADYSAKKAILQYCSVTSQIIMGGASHAPLKIEHFINSHIRIFYVFQ